MGAPRLGLVLVMLAACGFPDVRYLDAGVDGASDAGTDGAVDAAADGSAPVCTVDGDCRAFANYCMGSQLTPCQCYPLAKAAADPTCDGTMVNPATCVPMNPCLARLPRCDGGTCGLGP